MANALQKAMKAQKVTPAEMARRMGTSRPTVYRLLDKKERGATLDTLERASLALGLDLEVRLVPAMRTKTRRQPGGCAAETGARGAQRGAAGVVMGDLLNTCGGPSNRSPIVP